jgi:hypothetical protein
MKHFDKKHFGVRLAWLISVIYLAVWNAAFFISNNEITWPAFILLVVEVLIPAVFKKVSTDE